MAINYPTGLDTFTTRAAAQTISESHMNDVQDAIEALEAKVGIDGSAATTSIDYLVKNFITSGRKVWIYADSAPTGWTIYTTAADCVLAAKGGSNAYNVVGGNGTLYGAWAMTEAQMPAHVHGANWGSSGANSAYYQYSGATTGWNASFTTSAGSGASTYRPVAAVGIVITKT